LRAIALLTQSQIFVILTIRIGARTIHIVRMLITNRLHPICLGAALRTGRVRFANDLMRVTCLCAASVVEGSDRKQAYPRRVPDS